MNSLPRWDGKLVAIGLAIGLAIGIRLPNPALAQSKAEEQGEPAAQIEAAASVGNPGEREGESRQKRLRQSLEAVVASVDREVAKAWAEAEIVPASKTTDAEFLRRLYLDMVGRIPTAFEVRSFLEDPAVDKRSQVIHQLLEDAGFAEQFAHVWSEALVPEAAQSNEVNYVSSELRAWLRRQFAHNEPYDQWVHELLTLPVNTNGRTDAYALMSNSSLPTPSAFYAAKQMKPENLAAASARTFLAVRVECAQCHDHPFADWSREDFWGFAAFFAETESSGRFSFERFAERLFQGKSILESGLNIPGTNQTAKPRFLGEQQGNLSEAGSRQLLADWMTSDDNPYFAKAVVNRYWAYFVGNGFFEPIDDFDPTRPVSHPELLNELAEQFIAHDYDLKFLVKVITHSRAYQLSSELSDPSQLGGVLFSRYRPKLMSARQLRASLAIALGEAPSEFPMQFGFGNASEIDREFARDRFDAGEGERSVLQALLLMNGKQIASGTDLVNSRNLIAIAEMPQADQATRLEALFLTTLSRHPTTEEANEFLAWIKSDQAEPLQAWSDVLWVLLNTPEFSTNH